MGWRDHLQVLGERTTAPWTGGRTLYTHHGRVYFIEGALPCEHGWYQFEVSGRKAVNPVPAPPMAGCLRYPLSGYLVGDRLVPDATTGHVALDSLHAVAEKVYLLDEGLDRFAWICAGRMWEEGHLIFHSVKMAEGPEMEVLQAYLDRKDSLADIKGVTPGLDAAFRLECRGREDAERRRAELERLRREEEARLAREERRRELAEQLGDGAGRRRMAPVDFESAARAALAVGGAEFLDERRGHTRGERVVRYRLDGERFECVCDERTLAITDAGVCLTDERTGVKGDTLFTLESLPAVVREAERRGVLVVFRHV